MKFLLNRLEQIIQSIVSSPVLRHPDVKPSSGQLESDTEARNCDENPLGRHRQALETLHIRGIIMDSIQFITNRATYKYRVPCLAEARIYLAGQVL